MSVIPRLSVRLHGGMPVRQCVERAVGAEAAGYHGIWFAENPFERGVLPAATGCALATRRISIGIGVFNPFNRHPTLMAMEMGALDEVAGGRCLLGIGAGVPSTIRQMGYAFDRPLTAVREATEIARAMLAGGAADLKGRVFAVNGTRLGYPLVRAGMPILLAAMADRALRLCGAVGDGLIIGNMCPPRYTRHARALLDAGAAEAGRPSPPEIVKYLPCSIDATSARARAAVKPLIGRLLPAYWAAYETAPAVREAMVDETGLAAGEVQAAIARLGRGESPREVLDERFVRAYAIAGDPDECLEQLALHRRTGATEIAVTLCGEDPMAEIDALGRAARLHGRGQ